MRRRDFLEVIIGSTAAWPLAARAQQGERVRRIGVLTPLAADDPESMARIGAFLQGLGELGWALAAIFVSTTAGAQATLTALVKMRWN